VVANLTITVDEQTLKKARIRALEEGTSVNAVLRDYLESYAGVRRERLEALQRILEDSRKGGSGSGPGGRTWTREDAYEERLGRYGRD
jgi:plasmid stability protein